MTGAREAQARRRWLKANRLRVNAEIAARWADLADRLAAMGHDRSAGVAWKAATAWAEKRDGSWQP